MAVKGTLALAQVVPRARAVPRWRRRCAALARPSPGRPPVTGPRSETNLSPERAWLAGTQQAGTLRHPLTGRRSPP